MQSCNYGTFNQLCKVEILFKDCEPLVAQTDICKKSGPQKFIFCRKSAEIKGKLKSFESFVDSYTSDKVVTGFALQADKKYYMGDCHSKWVKSQGSRLMPANVTIVGISYDRKGSMDFF